MEGQREVGPFGVKITKDPEEYPWFWRFESEGNVNLIVSGQETSEYEAKRKVLLAIMDYIEIARRHRPNDIAMSWYLTHVMYGFVYLDDIDDTINTDTIYRDATGVNGDNIKMNLGNYFCQD